LTRSVSDSLKTLQRYMGVVAAVSAARDRARRLCLKNLRSIRVHLWLNNPSMDRFLRAAVIAEWRGLPERRTRPDRWQSPADLVPKLMRRLGLRERLHETEVIDAWSKLSANLSPRILRPWLCARAYFTSEFFNRPCITSWNRSPRSKSCEN